MALFGELTEELSSSGAGSDFLAPFPGFDGPDETDWSLGVQATFPLYSGGARRADLLRGHAVADYRLKIQTIMKK